MLMVRVCSVLMIGCGAAGGVLLLVIIIIIVIVLIARNRRQAYVVLHLITLAWTIDEVEGLPFSIGVRSWEEACPVPSKSELSFSSCVFLCIFKFPHQ